MEDLKALLLQAPLVSGRQRKPTLKDLLSDFGALHVYVYIDISIGYVKKDVKACQKGPKAC